jgi:hypothetical protein
MQALGYCGRSLKSGGTFVESVDNKLMAKEVLLHSTERSASHSLLLKCAGIEQQYFEF